MVRLRSGPPHPHIVASNGPDTNMMRFYSTKYSTEFGTEGYKPRTGRPTGTGYKSNFRPQLFYSRSMDNFDNPVMGFLLSDNYESVTSRHYRAAKDANGKEKLPRTVINQKQESGFTRQRPLTVPTLAEVRQSFYDCRKYGGMSLPGLQPHVKPVLHEIQRKDPVEQENKNRGPGFMTTEMKERFQGDQNPPLDIYFKDVGRLEESGHIHNINEEPITYRPNDPHTNEKPGWATDRPTGTPTTTDHFRQWQDVDGKAPLPNITDRSSHETGFIRERPKHLYDERIASKAYTSLKQAPHLVAERIRKNDPADYLNLKHPNNKKAVTFATYLGKQEPDMTTEKLLERENTGPQELSGHCENNDRYIETKDTNPRRYLTNYNLKHYDMNPTGVDREGWVMGGVQNAQEDGYCRDFKVHSHGRHFDTTERIRRLQPYVARSIKQQDEYFDDYKHSHKLAPSTMSALNKKALSTATVTA